MHFCKTFNKVTLFLNQNFTAMLDIFQENFVLSKSTKIHLCVLRVLKAMSYQLIFPVL